MILTRLQKLPNNAGNFGKISVATGFEWLPKVKKSPNLQSPNYTEILFRGMYDRILEAFQHN